MHIAKCGREILNKRRNINIVHKNNNINWQTVFFQPNSFRGIEGVANVDILSSVYLIVNRLGLDNNEGL